MYLSRDVGKLIHTLRMEKGITQEELSTGICSVSTISRIENGLLEPRGGLFRNIMERLGGSDFFHGMIFESDKLRDMAIKKEIRECYEYDDIPGFETALYRYYLDHDPADPHAVQFLEYMKLLSWYREISDREYFFDRACRILTTTRPEFDPGKGLEDIIPDGMELMILNGIMTSLPPEYEQDRFYQYFEKLYLALEETRSIKPYYLKAKASLYNNLAVFDLKTGNSHRALSDINRAITLSDRDGGLYFTLKLMRTRISVNKRLCRRPEVENDIQFIRRAFNIIRNQRRIPDGFFSAKKELLVF